MRDASQLRLTASITLRRTLERWPEVYLRWVDARVDHPNPLRDDTELLIDGFPSSANSYTRSWIHFANPGARIASHHHSGAIVRAAMRRGVPIVVPFREPTETVTSMLTRFPRYRLHPPHGARNLLRWYVRYHEPVLANPDAVVLVAFERATADLTGTVDALNDRFGTSLLSLGEEHWPKVLEYLRTKDGIEDEDDLRVSAPSETREAQKARYRAAVEAPELGRARDAAAETYRRLQDLDARASRTA